ncbi:uncharacterized protein LOC125551578 isoform X2 [Triticum urartu]|uniref:Secreted protein n=1 Tax=Triticum urartu TaxID=4572 RepID=A0A8R7Q2R6_TRIUA|nr:uncharacterized protein LOC125551578 isoform X2 [Triticum urartu]
MSCLAMVLKLASPTMLQPTTAVCFCAIEGRSPAPSSTFPHHGNNAGVMATPFSLSKDGIEMQFATNHIACKNFPHSRHLCSELPFSTTAHPKHYGMCYCYVCDAPAPCKHWGKGLCQAGLHDSMLCW